MRLTKSNRLTLVMLFTVLCLFLTSFAYAATVKHYCSLDEDVEGDGADDVDTNSYKRESADGSCTATGDIGEIYDEGTDQEGCSLSEFIIYGGADDRSTEGKCGSSSTNVKGYCYNYETGKSESDFCDSSSEVYECSLVGVWELFDDGDDLVGAFLEDKYGGNPHDCGSDEMCANGACKSTGYSDSEITSPLPNNQWAAEVVPEGTSNFESDYGDLTLTRFKTVDITTGNFLSPQVITGFNSTVKLETYVSSYSTRDIPVYFSTSSLTEFLVKITKYGGGNSRSYNSDFDSLQFFAGINKVEIYLRNMDLTNPGGTSIRFEVNTLNQTFQWMNSEPLPENTNSAWCSDGVDNDGDGYRDEEDADCTESAGTSCPVGEGKDGAAPWTSTCDEDCDSNGQTDSFQLDSDLDGTIDQCDGVIPQADNGTAFVNIYRDDNILEGIGECAYEPFRVTPTTETCNNIDDNCNTQVDENTEGTEFGLLNKCGYCGTVPDEVCGNYLDDDCDGEVDEECTETQVIFGQSKFWECSEASSPQFATYFADPSDVQVADRCQNIGTSYCEYTNEWKAADIYSDLDLISATKTLPDGSNPQCCPSTWCWNGNECTPNQRYDQSPPFNYNDEDYRCIDGAWAIARLKHNWDFSESGYCPNVEDCLVTNLGNPENNYNTTSYFLSQGVRADWPDCVSDDQYLRDHYCQNGSWTTRTKLLALTMMDLPEDEYSLHCDIPQNALNYWEAETLQQGVTKETASYIRSIDPDAYNNFCVLTYEDQTVVGTTVNDDYEFIMEDYLPIAMKNTFNISHFNDVCSDALDNPIGFERCNSRQLWWDNKTRAVIYSTQDIEGMPMSFFEGLWDGLYDFFVDPVESILTLLVGEYTVPYGSYEFINRTGDFDRIYLKDTEGKNIKGIVETKYDEVEQEQTFITATYSGFNTTICNSTHIFDLYRANPGEFDIACNEINNETTFIARRSWLYGLPDYEFENLWKDAVVSARIER